MTRQTSWPSPGVVLVFACALAWTAPASSSNVCFTAIGNWGTGTFQQRNIGASMKRVREDYAQSGRCVNQHHVLATGNNIYPDGYLTLSEMTTLYLQPYSYPFRKAWKAVPGPVDYTLGQQSVDSQIRINTAGPNFWTFPQEYHHSLMRSTLSSSPKAAAEVEIMAIGIDTVNFTAAQQSWVQRNLEQATLSGTPYVVVYGHHPVYSTGPFGSVMAGTILENLLEAYQVSAYISSHDISLQHHVVNGINYFVSGSAGLSPTSTAYDPTMTRFHKSVGGFMTCSATTTSMICDFLDSSDSVLYSVTIPPRVFPSDRPGRVALNLAARSTLPTTNPNGCFRDILVTSSDDPATLEATLTPEIRDPTHVTIIS